MTRDQFIYGLTACGCLLKDGKTWYEHNELIKCFEDLGLLGQEPRKGHWLHRPHVYGVTYCSICDFELKIDNTNYCPNCGADMREVKE